VAQKEKLDMKMTDWNAEKLIEFESEIAELFNSGFIRAPIHLYNGTENAVLEIFQKVKMEDWVFCSWRSHYQCLLKGVPKEEVRQAILGGKSISLCFPDYQVFSSAIVGGHLAIAVGVALGIKREGGSQHVWCFLGDMTAETGIAQTCIRYSRNHELPITFIVEDNSISVMTDTRQVWGSNMLSFEESPSTNMIVYKYKSKYPHAGAGTRVQF
jgi:pyruvate dehydrogenase E1 component alpha subunit